MSNFTFEKEEFRSQYESAREKNKTELLTRLNLSGAELSDEELKLVDTFSAVNMSNIDYYNSRIEKEDKLRKRYATASIALLIVIPIALFLVTDLIPTGATKLMQSTAGWITTVLGSILALHKTFSTWLDKRKFSSIFHQAKMDLMEVLYALIEDHSQQSRATGFNVVDGNVLSPNLVLALKTGIKSSRAIKNRETKEYFDLQSSPTFDLSSTLSGASMSAKDLLSGFKSRKFNLEVLEAEAAEDRAEMRMASKDLIMKKAQLKVKEDRLVRLTTERIKLVELIRKTDNEEDIKRYRAEFDVIDDEIEKIEGEIFVLKQERDYSKQIMEAYSED